jgi:hypothetical protein
MTLLALEKWQKKAQNLLLDFGLLYLNKKDYSIGKIIVDVICSKT